jgi:hypothetical protein
MALRAQESDRDPSGRDCEGQSRDHEGPRARRVVARASASTASRVSLVTIGAESLSADQRTASALSS